jgi:hypothetical protein
MTTNDAMFVAKYNAVMCTILSLFLQSWAEADVISIEKNVSIDNTKIKMTHFLHENQLSHRREGNKKINHIFLHTARIYGVIREQKKGGIKL